MYQIFHIPNNWLAGRRNDRWKERLLFILLYQGQKEGLEMQFPSYPISNQMQGIKTRDTSYFGLISFLKRELLERDL